MVQIIFENDPTLDAPNREYRCCCDAGFLLLTFGTRQTLEDVSNGFDKQRRRICVDIVNIISAQHVQLHRRALKLLTKFCRNGLLRDSQPCASQKVACSSSVMLAANL